MNAHISQAYSNVTVKAGTTFNGTLPLSTQPLDQSGGGRHQMEDWGEQKLFAVLAAEVLEGMRDESCVE